MEDNSFYHDMKTINWRFTRADFILYILWGIFIPQFIYFLINMPFMYSGYSINKYVELLIVLVLVILIFYIIFVSYIKRLHDLNKSWFYSLLFFIPIVNILLLGFLLFFKWTNWVNLYWEDKVIIKKPKDVKIKNTKNFSELENNMEEALKDFKVDDFNKEFKI